jgi:hypothetical protein
LRHCSILIGRHCYLLSLLCLFLKLFRKGKHIEVLEKCDFQVGLLSYIGQKLTEVATSLLGADTTPSSFDAACEGGGL